MEPVTGREAERLGETREGHAPWRLWGPYLSERQWGTVREDESEGGDAWNAFTHDQARSRAYKWGEDGIAGWSDDKQRLCLSVALWNERDPILKERLFGLTNAEGNHGEDVKELYYYVDALPTHAYNRMLYKYPQRAYPYDALVHHGRGRGELEYELVDTGIFDDDRYFDVEVEYAKDGPESTLLRITVHNRGPETAAIHVLPTFLFRNTWFRDPEAIRPLFTSEGHSAGHALVRAAHPELGLYRLAFEAAPEVLFTENETNTERLFGRPNQSPYVKDGIDRAVVHGEAGAVNPDGRGTKGAAHYRLEIPGGGARTIRARLHRIDQSPERLFGDAFDAAVEARLREADAFYGRVIPENLDEDRGRVMRQALAGMLWSKQYYGFDVSQWLLDRGLEPGSAAATRALRNRDWFHMINDDVISMPDKWEYPWYAAWDLAFHTVALALVDIDFAKRQLALMLEGLYIHPSGQIPAYEWNFGDVNPPVHAWAAQFLYQLERFTTGRSDTRYLRAVFHKLMLNFTWWVNRKDPDGNNVFSGGFLGLDNIGVFDRSAPLPTGGSLEQSDGTAWMAFYCQAMLGIALELSQDDPSYQDMASKFLEHFLWIASGMDRIGAHEDEMWDEEDGFFYDVLRLPDGRGVRLKVRSLVGLLPLAAVSVVGRDTLARFPYFIDRAMRFVRRRGARLRTIAPPDRPGHRERRMLAVVDETKLRRLLARMLDEDEFLSPYGLRSLSKVHAAEPYTFWVGDQANTVAYRPAESDNAMFGGNSNWRGPIWFPMNALLVRALLQYHAFYGPDFQVECPTGSGRMMNLYEVAREITERLEGIFLRDRDGRRPVFGGAEKLQRDPHFRDLLLFYEYFHGENGAGLGASHQTGWTGLVAPLTMIFARSTAAAFVPVGEQPPAAERQAPPPSGTPAEPVRADRRRPR